MHFLAGAWATLCEVACASHMDSHGRVMGNVEGLEMACLDKVKTSAPSS